MAPWLPWAMPMLPDDQFVPSPQLLSVACDSTKDVHFHALMAAEPCADMVNAVGQASAAAVRA